MNKAEWNYKQFCCKCSDVRQQYVVLIEYVGQHFHQGSVGYLLSDVSWGCSHLRLAGGRPPFQGGALMTDNVVLAVGCVLGCFLSGHLPGATKYLHGNI